MSNLIVCTPARERIVVGKDHEFFAAINLNPPAMADAQRAPLDIAVAMDVSGSMGGPKIEAAKQSLLKLVEHLKETDRLGLVTFTSHVETVFTMLPMTADNKASAKRAIGQLCAQSATNLSGGLFLALDQLKETPVNAGAVRRCLIFTDGLANNGITNPDRLAEAALEYRSGIGISAFGYGSDHNPVLLERISQDGEFYFIDSPDKILTAFGNELGGLISTYAQNVQLTLTPAEGVKIAEVLNDLTVREEDGSAVIECDDLLAEQEYAVVLRLQVDKRDNSHPRPVTLVSAKLSYFDVQSAKKVTETSNLQLRFVKAGKEDKKDNEQVINQVALQKSIQAQAQAIKLADVGDYAGSRQVLLCASGGLRELGTSQAFALADVQDGLAAENFTADAYLRGGSSQARSLRKGLSRRRVGAVASKGGVNLRGLYGGTQAQDEMARNFEAADDEDGDEKDGDDEDGGDKKDPAKSVSKSRSRASW